MKIYIALLCVSLPLFSFADSPNSFQLLPQYGHAGSVNAVTFSPDGKYLASGGSDQSIYLWEVLSGKKVLALQKPMSAVNAIAFSPDGSQLASGSDDKLVRLWDISTKKVLRSFKEHNSEITSVAFSADGSRILSASRDGIIKLWDASSEKSLITITGSNKGTNAIFLAGGKHIASAGADGNIKIWDTSNGKELRTLTGHTGTITALVASADGASLASSDADGNIKLWDTSGGKELRSWVGHYHKINALVIDSKGKQIASADTNDTIKFWDASSGKELRTISGNKHKPNTLAFDPTGEKLASGGTDETVRLWETSSGRALYTSKNNRAGILAFNPTGQFLTIARRDNKLSVWDITKGRLAYTFSLYEGRAHVISPSSDGGHLASGGDTTAWIWDLKMQRMLRMFKDSSVIHSVAFDFDRRLVAAGKADGTIKLWNITTEKVKTALTGHTAPVTALQFNATGKMLVSSSPDGTIKLWDGVSSKELRTISFPGVQTVVFSPDGKTLASAGLKDIKLWDVSTGKELDSWRGHNNVTSLAFSPNGQRLVSGSNTDTSVYVWEIRSGNKLYSFEEHDSFILSVGYSPDGKHIAASGADGTVRLWSTTGDGSNALMVDGDTDWLMFNDEGYFDGSLGGASLVAAVEDMRGYNIEQMAFKYNRADLLLENILVGSVEAIEYYYKRHKNRLNQAKLQERKLKLSFDGLPTATITQAKNVGQDAELSFVLEDTQSLQWCQIYVNGVPLYTGFGRALKGKKESITETFKLTRGENRIEVSALNAGGQESIRARHIFTAPEDLTRDLYFIGFGISDYKDQDIPDLKFAHKDATELGSAFDKIKGHDKKHKKIFTNEQVTKKSIQEAKEFAKKARAQDTVVLFVTGYGLHAQDELATYYYVLSDTQIDIDKDGSILLDEDTALSFTELEGLLSGIDAKQRLIFTDVSTSGEHEDVTDFMMGRAPTKARTIEKITRGKKTSRPWLLERDRFIYQESARCKDAVWFSSLGEYAYESDNMENGIFADSLILSFSRDDYNKDGSIERSEFERSTVSRVSYISRTFQRPRIECDNPSLDLSFTP
jgi:WD40 repeat protein